MFYKRVFLSEACFWFVTNLMSVDHTGQLRSYLSTHSDFFRSLKTTVNIKKQTPNLKIELISMLEIFEHPDISPLNWVEMLETEVT